MRESEGGREREREREREEREPTEQPVSKSEENRRARQFSIARTRRIGRRGAPRMHKERAWKRTEGYE